MSHFSPFTFFEAVSCFCCLIYSTLADPKASWKVSYLLCLPSFCKEFRIINVSPHPYFLKWVWTTELGFPGLHHKGSCPPSHLSVPKGPFLGHTSLSHRQHCILSLPPACPDGMLPAQNVLSSSVTSYLEATLVLSWFSLKVSFHWGFLLLIWRNGKLIQVLAPVYCWSMSDENMGDLR